MCRASSRASRTWSSSTPTRTPIRRRRACSMRSSRRPTNGLERYPDPESMALREAIAARHGLHGAQVFVGNGSDEVLAHAFFAFFQQAEPLLVPDVTYSFYRVYAQLYGIDCELQPVDERPAHRRRRAGRARRGRLRRHRDRQSECADRHRPAARAHRAACSQACPQRVVLVDEAYVDFGGESALPLIARYPEPAGRADAVQVAFAGRPARGLRLRAGAPDRGAAAGQEQLQFLSARPAGDRPAPSPRSKTRPGSPRRATRSSTPAKAWRCSWRIWASRCCPRRPTSCSCAIPRTMPPQLAAALRERAVLVRHFSAAAHRAVPAHQRRHARPVQRRWSLRCASILG